MVPSFTLPRAAIATSLININYIDITQTSQPPDLQQIPFLLTNKQSSSWWLNYTVKILTIFFIIVIFHHWNHTKWPNIKVHIIIKVSRQFTTHLRYQLHSQIMKFLIFSWHISKWTSLFLRHQEKEISLDGSDPAH